MASTTYIALLFSIGVADGRRLIMSDWRSLLNDLGLENPRTLIATGNAVFQCQRTNPCELETRLEKAYEKRFGRRVDNIVREAAHFQRLAAGNPFPRESGQDGSRVMVRVMREPLKAGTAVDLQRYLTRGERIKIVRGDLWIHFKQEPNGSRILNVLGSKRLGIGTVRNWNTIRRLNEMLV